MKPNRIHCFFEQTNTFRDVAASMGYDAESYDIEGNPTHKIDLFKAIEEGDGNEFLIANRICLFRKAGRKNRVWSMKPNTESNEVLYRKNSREDFWKDSLDSKGNKYDQKEIDEQRTRHHDEPTRL